MLDLIVTKDTMCVIFLFAKVLIFFYKQEEKTSKKVVLSVFLPVFERIIPY